MYKLVAVLFLLGTSMASANNNNKLSFECSFETTSPISHCTVDGMVSYQHGRDGVRALNENEGRDSAAMVVFCENKNGLVMSLSDFDARVHKDRGDITIEARKRSESVKLVIDFDHHDISSNNVRDAKLKINGSDYIEGSCRLDYDRD